MNPTFRRQLIRLGSENPNLRPAIRQIVTAASQPKMTKKVHEGQVPKDLKSALTKLPYIFNRSGYNSYNYLRGDLGEFSDGSFGYQAKGAPISVTVKAGEKGFEVHISGKTFRENNLQAALKRLAGSKAVSDATRQAAIKHGQGYDYALEVDRGPRSDTRKAAIKEGKGYYYAVKVDEAPRDDTRAAAIKEGFGYWYARFIDKGPRDDTRAAAIQEGRGYLYALKVDKGPRDDTRKAASREGNGYVYALDVDKAPHPDTRAAATKEGKQKEYEAAFGPA